MTATLCYRCPPPKPSKRLTVDADYVIDLYKRAKAESDPKRRTVLMRQAQELSQQLESQCLSAKTVIALLQEG